MHYNIIVVVCLCCSVIYHMYDVLDLLLLPVCSTSELKVLIVKSPGTLHFSNFKVHV